MDRKRNGIGRKYSQQTLVSEAEYLNGIKNGKMKELWGKQLLREGE